jgi:predicted DNA-binding protein
MAKVRKQIYLEKKHNEQLKRLAEARGVSEAEVIRQAIEREVEFGEDALQRRLAAFAEFEAAALARRDLVTAAEPYQWNREENYAERENRYFRNRE